MQEIKKKKPVMQESFKDRHGEGKESIGAEAAVGIMKHKDGTIEKRKF